MNKSNFISFENSYFQILITVLLFLPFFYFPVAGKIVSLFAPIPIVISSLYLGTRQAVTIGGLAFLIIAVIVQEFNALFYLIEVAVLGIVMGETIKQRFSFEKVILGTALVSTIVALVVFTVTGGGEKIKTTLKVEIERGIEESIKLYEEADVDQVAVENFKAISSALVRFSLMAFPSLLAISLLMGAFISYYGSKMLWRVKLQNLEEYFENRPAFYFKLPDKLVWVFIASCFLTFIGGDFFLSIGLNGLVISFVLYFFQGIALIHYIFVTKNVPLFIRFLFYFFVALQPILSFFVAGTGIMDTWLDVRKIGKKTPPGDQNNNDL